MTEQLKPCPFCGCTKIKKEDRGSNSLYRYCFVCSGCGATSGACRTKEDALLAWNRRVK